MIRIREPSGCTAQIDPACGGTVGQISLPEDLLYTPESASGCETEWFAGRVLLPFADRIAGGRYRWGETEYALPLNDPEHGDAIHGFLYRRRMQVGEHTANRLVLHNELEGEEGYPWPLSVTVSYRIDPGVFWMSVETRNRGVSSAPLTVGWHPYFDVDHQATLQVRASRYIEADESLRLTGRRPSVSGTVFDFREPRVIGGEPLDVAVELDDTDDDPVVIADSRRVVSITPAGVFRRIQLFTPPGSRGIAVEPVSAPGEAFNDPELGVIELKPGASAVGSVMIRLDSRRGPAP